MTEVRFYPLVGGMDVVTPSISIPPGRVISCQNYESSARGYRKIDGWERFDGRQKPSASTYQVIHFENGSFVPQQGNVITGVSSGKTAKVVYEASLYGGFIVQSTAVGAFPVIDNTGLLDGEEIRFGSIPIGRIVSSSNELAAISLEEERLWSLAAMDDARSKIGVVPGSGPIRGIWTYKGDVYSFRDNASGTAGGMYKASTNGWQLVTHHSTLSFDEGTGAFSNGDVITGSTSGAKGTLRNVVLQDGDWTTNDGEGYLVLSPVIGSSFVFQDNETITSPGGGNAKVNGSVSAITIPPGGRYSFDNHNFKGTTGTLNMYFANGVGNAFEFDGTTLTPIRTGEEDDRPIRIIAHSDHLFLGYENGRIMHSAIFNPLNFEIIQGALLAGIADEITDMVPTATGDLAIFGRNKVAVLYGKNSETWNLMVLTNESGAQPWTAQLIGAPLYLDQIGIRSLDTTQSYGNFALGTRTQLIEKHMATKMNAGVRAIGSLRIRRKDMYRLYWSDGTGVSIYFGRKQPENMLFDLGFVPTSTCSGEDINGREILFVGSESGYVYQMDSGNSADGLPITAYVRLPFNHVGSPAYNKRWNKIDIEIDASPQTKIAVTYTLSYGDTNIPQSPETFLDVFGGGGFWNEAIWDTFYWDSQVEGIASLHLDGIGQNLSVVIISDEVYPAPYTIHGMTLYFNYRRLAR